MKRQKISLCMIALNEESFLGKSLKNASPFVDEIIIIDGGSTDKTLEIAKTFGSTIIEQTWEEDFAKQRNISLKHATGDWILVMDADEIYETKLLKELRRFTENNIGLDAFAFPRKNYIDGSQISAYPDKQIRFFKNNGKIRYQGRLHEQPMGWKRIAHAIDLHIIHRKSSIRQKAQSDHYKRIERLIAAMEAH